MNVFIDITNIFSRYVQLGKVQHTILKNIPEC